MMSRVEGRHATRTGSCSNRTVFCPAETPRSSRSGPVAWWGGRWEGLGHRRRGARLVVQPDEIAWGPDLVVPLQRPPNRIVAFAAVPLVTLALVPSDWKLFRPCLITFVQDAERHRFVHVELEADGALTLRHVGDESGDALQIRIEDDESNLRIADKQEQWQS